MMRQAGVVKTSSPKDRVVNRHKDRSRREKKRPSPNKSDHILSKALN
ncbi:hypothetical protein Acr_24g0003070 [Actinidia rufa]|uniref:Uncharacterized protein n=1 Tax=Actinidia rufa TaxID=165716 RepID=A0A7J0GTF2_9ERIC|nr:hypothetical protein Acr_24g0003070 [Actinidia rufa]